MVVYSYSERMIELTTSTVVLSMARRFNASDKAVYEAWTDPQLMKKWLFTTEDTNQVIKNSLRAGEAGKSPTAGKAPITGQ